MTKKEENAPQGEGAVGMGGQPIVEATGAQAPEGQVGETGNQGCDGAQEDLSTERVQPYTPDIKEEVVIEGMVQYIGTKIIKAKEMTGEEFLGFMGKNMGDGPGYLVRYPDGYKSWSPKDVFEEAYLPSFALSYGLAYEMAKKGHFVVRKGWIDPVTGIPSQVVIMQVHADIPADVIPKMISLPEDFKKFAEANLPDGLHYRNQMLLVKVPSGIATSFVPDTFDQAATDWVAFIDEE